MDRASDIIPAFIGAMEAMGIRPAEPIADRLGPEIIRFQCEGDRAGRKNGWAVLYLDGRPAGSFGSYRLGISEKWKADSDPIPFSLSERRAWAKSIRETERRRAAELIAAQRNAAAQSVSRWDKAGAVDPAHPYLFAKGINGEGLRQSGDKLLVPMFDEAGVLWSLQSIWPDGTKRYPKGGRQKGLFFLLGQPDAIVCVAEGYGTGAVVRRATGHAVAISFTSGNMLATAMAMRDRYPNYDLVMLADDDPHLIDHPTIQRNVGLEEAHAAAKAVGGRVAIPPRKDAA